MVRYKREKGGNKTKKTGERYVRKELEKVYDLYIELEGKGIHENNPKIHELANILQRDVRSVENQLLGYKIVETGKTGRANYNKLIKVIWDERKIDDTDLKFKVSSGLKTILGKDLITDDFIAIYELVKNSYDAHASEVIIEFINPNTDKFKIVIQDNGKGMSYEDLLNKWLFVAYSAKKDGTEDLEEEKRNKRFYAGAKGVGRFSCDRLGETLELTTTKDSKTASTEYLFTDWTQFEEDSKKEFKNIGVKHKTLKTNPFPDKHGTMLEIEGVRAECDRIKYLKLKRALEKLINPIRTESDKQYFSINIKVDSELNEDEKQTEYYDTVNGQVKNFLFERLELKTTQLVTEISDDGKTINTTLSDRGTSIYSISEELPAKFNLLKGIRFNLFYLNQAAKVNFKIVMGLRVKEYGSVFLYKNGFRINPYGDPGDDSFGIDLRKGQGFGRYLGLRELIGRIEINGINSDFKETTSRDGGLIKNRAYNQLKDCFETYSLKRLEKYVVDVIKWGTNSNSYDEDLNNLDSKDSILKLIQKLTDSSGVINIEYSPEILKIIDQRQEKSASSLLGKFKQTALEARDNEALKEIKKAERELDELRYVRQELEEETFEKGETLKLKRGENLALRSQLGVTEKELLSYHHHIGISTSVIEGYLSMMTETAKTSGEVPLDEFNDFVKDVSYELSKIITIVNFATKKGYNLDSEFQEDDLVDFVTNYINDVSKKVVRTHDEDPMNFEIVCKKGTVYYTEFAILGITIILDNLFKNSTNARAHNIWVNINSINEDVLEIRVKDNGVGVDKKVKNELFEFGITTTDGSGMGLYHIQDLMTQMNGNVKCNFEESNGAEFILTFEKNN